MLILGKRSEFKYFEINVKLSNSKKQITLLCLLYLYFDNISVELGYSLDEKSNSWPNFIIFSIWFA